MLCMVDQMVLIEHRIDLAHIFFDLIDRVESRILTHISVDTLERDKRDERPDIVENRWWWSRSMVPVKRGPSARSRQIKVTKGAADRSSPKINGTKMSSD